MVVPPARRLLAPNPSLMTGEGTNTYLVGKHDVVVVDPGPDLSAHVDAILVAATSSGGKIVALLVTHGHSDHLPAARRLREQIGAPIVGHERLRDIDQILRDGESITFGDETIVAYETLGHADDHLAYWRDADRSLFAGDLIAGVGTVVLSQSPGSLTRYLASLTRVLDLRPTRILPGHGPIVEDPETKLREYLEHRSMRERQFVAMLETGPATVDELVRRIYAGTHPNLLALAARNVRAHLEHLETQGKATRVDNSWQLT